MSLISEHRMAQHEYAKLRTLCLPIHFWLEREIRLLRDHFTPRGAYTSRLSKFYSKTSYENFYKEGMLGKVALGRSLGGCVSQVAY